MDTFAPSPESTLFFEQFLRSVETQSVPQTPKLISQDGTSVEISREVSEILALIARDFHAGKSVTIISHEARLTTQQAADFIGVSRPTLIKLLEEFTIPFDSTGRHRRIAIADVQALQRQLRHSQRLALSEMRKIARAAGEHDDDFSDNPLIAQ